MGWRADGGLWLLVRGGGLFLSKGTGVCGAHLEDLPFLFCLAKWGSNSPFHLLAFGLFGDVVPAHVTIVGYPPRKNNNNNWLPCMYR